MLNGSTLKTVRLVKFTVASLFLILLTGVLPMTATAGPYDDEINEIEKELSLQEDQIPILKSQITNEQDKILSYQDELEEIRSTISAIEEQVIQQDNGMLVYPIRLEILADEYIEVWASRSGPFKLRRELAVDSYVRNDERMNSVLTQSAQLTDTALEGIRSRMLYDALIEETEDRLNIVDARMRITGDRISGVFNEIKSAEERQAESFQELSRTRDLIPTVNEKIDFSHTEIQNLKDKILQVKDEIAWLENEITRFELLSITKSWTGLPGEETARPALAFKIDNVSIARPQEGINQADVVYEELVEAGLTRLVAIFQTTDARSVGPIRSARTSDPPLLAAFDNPLFAYSGANRGTREIVKKADLTDVGYDSASNRYWRSTSRRAPHNLFSATDRLWNLHPDRTQIPPAPFTFRTINETLHPSAEPVSGVFVDFGHAEIEYTWNGEGWERTHNGQPHTDSDGVRVAPANVVVQFISYGTSIADSRSPEAITTGSGDVWVLTDGHVVRGTWKRSKESEPATLEANGKPIRLTPGRTWIALARSDSAALR